LTIASIAEEVARLYALRDRMEVGEWTENKLGIVDSDEPLIPFDHHVKQADRHIDALEAVLLQLEPASPDEALSLLLVASTLFDGWASDAYDGREISPRAENEELTIEYALAAVVRRLHREGARSPLMDQHFAHHRLEGPAEQAEAALARAAELEERLEARSAADRSVIAAEMEASRSPAPRATAEAAPAQPVPAPDANAAVFDELHEDALAVELAFDSVLAKLGKRADLADLHAEAWGATQVLDRLIDKLACLVHETRTEPSAGPSG
jgi:hypothetical protein